jgi:hypothetical protein
MKKQKICPKNQNQPETKNQTELRYIFFMNFKGKKTHNMNSHHLMKLFDTTSAVLAT